MTNTKDTNESDVVWKGSTALLAILLILSLISWVNDRKHLSAHGTVDPKAEEARLAELEAKDREINVANSALNDMGKENSSLRDELSEAKKALTAAQAAKSKTVERVASKSDETAAIKKLLEETRKKLSKSEAVANEARVDLIRVEEHRDSLLKEKKRWKNSQPAAAVVKPVVSNDALKKANERVKRLEGEVDEKRTLLEERTREVNELLADNAQIKGELDNSKKSAKKQADLMVTSQKEIVDLKSKVTALEAQIKAGSGRSASSSREVASLKKQVETMRRKNIGLKKEANKRAESLVKANHNLDRMERRLAENERELAKARKDLAKSKTVTRAAPSTPAVVTNASTGSGDSARQLKVLGARLAKAESEIRRLNQDRFALIEEYKRSVAKAKKLQAELDKLKK